MKVVILAGGLGTRLSEETAIRPKPMVEIGGRPILWHILKLYSSFGLNDFVICLGYKGYMIKEYFRNYWLHASDVTVDVAANSVRIHQSVIEPWSVTLVDTGDETATGGRLLRVADYLDEPYFYLTYGDGVGNVDMSALTRFHLEEGRLATVTAVRPPGRFGALDLENGAVVRFKEKPEGDGGWINGGFFVLSRNVLRYIEASETVWENEPLERLAADRQLSAYRHHGFWQPMDTVRDKIYLESLWSGGKAPWKIW